MSSYLYQTCFHIFINHIFISLSHMSSHLQLLNMSSYLYQTRFHIFIKHVFISLSHMSSYLFQTCLHIFIKHVFISLSNRSTYLYRQFKYMISYIHMYLHHLRVYYELTKYPAPRWLDSSVGRALPQYRRVHMFESRSCLIFFSGFNFPAAQVVYITALIKRVFIYLYPQFKYMIFHIFTC